MKIDAEKRVVEEICGILKEARLERGISQNRLAEMAGISRTGLRHIESQNISPTLYSLLKVAKALGLSLPDILNRL